MLVSSTKPLRDKEDQETPRRKRIIEREKIPNKKNKKQNELENFEIKTLEDRKMNM
jgi:hypothetical protein